MDATSDFSTCSLQDTPFRRRSRVAPAYRKPGYDAAFDATTLWMDAVWQDGAVTLTCPRLNNLAALLKRGRLTLDGRPVRPSVRSFYRHSVVILKSPQRPESVALEIDGHRVESSVRGTEPERFRDRNVIVTMSRDNDLVWIEDFARFHTESQGAEAIVFIDNGSSAYGVAELEACLERVGLDALVLRTELPFGPRGIKPHANSELFLQTCALNAVRLRYLQEARAVLFCDIDELVLSRGEDTVFDAAALSRFGYTRFRGVWRHARVAPGTAVVRHADHVFRRPGEAPCPHKWCVRPSGPVGQTQWRPHSLEGFHFNWLFDSSAFTFHHCRQITTGWKRNPASRAGTAMVEDLSAAALVQRRARGALARPAPSRLRRQVGRLAEAASRQFFGLTAMRQLTTAAVILGCFSVVLEEALDNDPPQQEIYAFLDAVKRVSQLDPF